MPRAESRFAPLLPALLAALVAAGCGASAPEAPRGWHPTRDEAEREAHGGWISLRLRAPLPDEVYPREDEDLVRFRDATVRRSPTFESRGIARLTQDDPVRVLRTEGDWLEVELPDRRTGFVYSREQVLGKDARRIGGELIAVESDSVFLLNRVLVGIPRSNIRKGSLRAYSPPDRGRVGAWIAAGTLSTLGHGFFFLLTLPAWLLVGIPTAAAVSHVGVIPFEEDRIEEIRAYARFPQGMPEGIDRTSLKEKRLGRKTREAGPAADDEGPAPSGADPPLRESHIVEPRQGQLG